MAQVIATTAAFSAVPAMAETIACVMQDETSLRFTIDRDQFAAPRDANEPPRQQRTIVSFGTKTFPATPFLLGGTRGFEAESLGGTTTLFVMQANGAARLSNARDGMVVTGNCRVVEDAE